MARAAVAERAAVRIPVVAGRVAALILAAAEAQGPAIIENLR